KAYMRPRSGAAPSSACHTAYDRGLLRPEILPRPTTGQDLRDQGQEHRHVRHLTRGDGVAGAGQPREPGLAGLADLDLHPVALDPAEFVPAERPRLAAHHVGESQ